MKKVSKRASLKSWVRVILGEGTAKQRWAPEGGLEPGESTGFEGRDETGSRLSRATTRSFL